jgi:type IV pilus assembly protein PilY1
MHKGGVIMKATRERFFDQAGRVSLLFVGLLCLATSAFARDTDIYSANTKQNCYVLMDNSGSMSFGVYEHTIDYGAMFDYLFTLKDDDYGGYIYDTINNSAVFYGSANHKPARQIYLWLGQIGATIATVDGQSVAFPGDAADPDYLWYSNTLVDTHTVIDNDGNLSHDGSAFPRRITVDTDGYILLDNARLPLGLNIKAHDFVTLYNGSVVDNGFNGLLNAPGYYFSGYEYTGNLALPVLDPVESGDLNVYFFVTGNWVNMQAMYNLHYTTNNPTPPGAFQGDPAWPYEPFPIPPEFWPQISHTLDYPEGSTLYANNLLETDTAETIVHAGAQKIQIHFSAFDVEGDGVASTYTKDYVKIYDSTGTQVAQYDNDNKPTNSNDGWSPVITGSTVILKLRSDGATTGAGYTIDKIRVVYVADGGGSYLMQSRLDVAKDSLVYVVEEFRSKMNWGFATYNNGDGAKIQSALNPNLTDDQNRAAIVEHVEGVDAEGGTPLMEALQDVFEQGYYIKRHELDNLLCRKNYIISMTDGFPSVDTVVTKIDGVTFADWDGDNWTSDPYQPPTVPNFYDDVGHWLYTHSWLDKTEVTDPENSYVNVTTHHIAFGAKHPLLQDAAGESGGEYIVAYNKEQLVAAFYSLALMMSESVSFTAPVVSTDVENKIQSGDDLYMGLFLPLDSTYWAGNLKKFKLGDGSSDRPTLFMIYDKLNHEALDSTGTFLDNTAAFWGDDLDPNDTDNYGAADIKEDGAGEVLVEDVTGFFTAGTFWNRPVYTWKDGDGDGDKEMVKFDRDHITTADLAVTDDATRDKLINFIHGYTYDAVANTGTPLAVRDWILGAIIHSRPVVVDYSNTADPTLPLLKRLVVVGSNDGMLHVFDDTTGREVFAFIPPDILPKLKEMQSTLGLYDTVDGLITLYKRDKNPKYLIFGERRGGGYFWNLDVSDMDPLQWAVAWNYTNAEISQSWSEVKVASIPVAISLDGVKSYKDVAIFTGGYDPEEDFFPEPFSDLDSNGTPYQDNGTIDNKEWSKTTATQDVNGDDIYNKHNPAMNERGRGIFVVDIDNPTLVVNATLDDNSTKQLLPFSVTYGAASVTIGATQKLADMKFSFPASPSVVTGTDKYIYNSGDDANGDPVWVTAWKENVLLSIYAVDVYANLFKTRFTFDLVNANPNGSPYWEVSSADWRVNKVFSANPGYTIGSGRIGTSTNLPDMTDMGRKAFYPPTIAWGGSKGFFESGNYYFPDVTFDTKNKMASLFFGTGDRENPKYAMIRNRFYAIYDDSSVTATLSPLTNVPVTSATYYENDLLNLTCDELGKDSIINKCYLGSPLSDGTTCTLASADVDMKRYLNSLLTDNAVYGTTPALEYGPAHENDAKGWYIVLEDQGDSTVCSHVTYPTAISAVNSDSHDNHDGEQILSKAILYYGTLYFTSYQASFSDPCNPTGNGFSYAINYLNGSATYDLSGDGKTGLADRYKKFVDIKGIPSGFTIVLMDGHAAAMASVGGAIKGPAPETLENPLGFEIDTFGLGLDLYYWRDSNSQQP